MVKKLSTQSSKTTQRVSTTGKDEILKGSTQVNQPKHVETSTSGGANEIIPGLSLTRTIGASSHPETQGRNPNTDDIIRGISSGVLTRMPQVNQPRQATSSAKSSLSDIIPGFSLSSTIEPQKKESKAIKDGRAQEKIPVSGGDSRITSKGQKKTSVHTAGKMRQIIPGATTIGASGTFGMNNREIVPGISANGRATPVPTINRAFSTKVSHNTEDQQKFPKPSDKLNDQSFSCELCSKGFSSRQGLFIHFGKQEKHFPCKQKLESRETCLRVFDTEVKLRRHKESHK